MGQRVGANRISQHAPSKVVAGSDATLRASRLSSPRSPHICQDNFGRTPLLEAVSEKSLSQALHPGAAARLVRAISTFALRDTHPMTLLNARMPRAPPAGARQQRSYCHDAVGARGGPRAGVRHGQEGVGRGPPRRERDLHGADFAAFDGCRARETVDI